MGRAPCCSKVGLHRGPWTAKEDSLLTNYVQLHGEGHWRSLPKKAGLLRCGKSCRLRWMNYLRPDIKRGNITEDEDDLIIRLHALLGNRWSLIAGRLPGRTDNEIKNYWNTHLSKKLKNQGTNPNTHKKLSDIPTAQEPKKKRNNNKNISKQKSKIKGNAKIENIKVHNPKPIRVSSLKSFSMLSRNGSFECSIQGNREFGTTEVACDPSSNFHHSGNVVRFFTGDDQDQDQDYNDVMNNLEYIKLYEATRDDDTLEKLYEEYLQLLNTQDNDQIQLDSLLNL